MKLRVKKKYTLVSLFIDVKNFMVVDKKISKAFVIVYLLYSIPGSNTKLDKIIKCKEILKYHANFELSHFSFNFKT